MIKEAIATGATVEEAKEAALSELGAKITDDVDFEVIDFPEKKTLGLFGGKPAKVRAYMEAPGAQSKTFAKTKKAKPLKEAVQKTEIKTETKAKQKEPLQQADMSSETVQKAQKYLTDILTLMDIENIKIEAFQVENGVQFNIEADNLGIIIGRRGDTIDAIQHLVSLSTNKKNEYMRICLNPGGYREKREATLIDMASRAANNVFKTRRNNILDPMNAYERRIVHNAVQEIDGVNSWSIGEGDSRRVCIGFPKSGGNNFSAGTQNRGPRIPDYTKRETEKENKTEPQPAEEKKSDSEGTSLYGRIK